MKQIAGGKRGYYRIKRTGENADRNRFLNALQEVAPEVLRELPQLLGNATLEDLSAWAARWNLANADGAGQWMIETARRTLEWWSKWCSHIPPEQLPERAGFSLLTGSGWTGDQREREERSTPVREREIDSTRLLSRVLSRTPRGELPKWRPDEKWPMGDAVAEIRTIEDWKLWMFVRWQVLGAGVPSLRREWLGWRPHAKPDHADRAIREAMQKIGRHLGLPDRPALPRGRPRRH